MRDVNYDEVATDVFALSNYENDPSPVVTVHESEIGRKPEGAPLLYSG